MRDHSSCLPEKVYVSSQNLNTGKGDESHAVNSSVAANVVLHIFAACFRIMAALLVAPGNHSGTYFKKDQPRVLFIGLVQVLLNLLRQVCAGKRRLHLVHTVPLWQSTL